MPFSFLQDSSGGTSLSSSQFGYHWSGELKVDICQMKRLCTYSYNNVCSHMYTRTHTHTHTYMYRYTGYAQKKGAVSKGNKKCISHLTRTQRTPSAAATVQVSHALPAVPFSRLLRGQFPRWRRSRKRFLCASF